MFGREPVLIAGAIRAVLLVAVSFGVDITPEQLATLMIAVEAVLTVVTRQTVTSPATLREAGTSKAEITLQAEVGRAKEEAKAEKEQP